MSDKKRISVTLTKAYADAMDRLIENGIHFSYSEMVLTSLRRYLRACGIPPFGTADLPNEAEGP